MSDTEILMIKNPMAFDVMEVRDFITRAMQTSIAEDKPAEIELLRAYVGSPHLHTILAKREGRFVGLAVVALPATPLSPAPQVYHIYNEGDPQDRRVLVHAVVSFVKSHGYGTLMTANLNGREKAFKRLFRAAGPASKIGTLYRFDLNAGEEKWAASSTPYSEAAESRAERQT